jgi:hypothetical protein
MRVVRKTAGALTLAFLASLVPQSALACACCDGSSRRTPLGWSSAGQLLVEVESVIGCERRHYYEVWSTDGRRVQCFDLHGDPNAAIACDATMEDADQDTGPSSARPSYGREARPLDPAMVRARLEGVPDDVRARLRAEFLASEGAGEEDEEDSGEDYGIADGAPTEVLVVEVLSAGAFREVFRMPIQRGGPEEFDVPALESSPPLPIVVTLWPSPGSSRAALLVRGHNTAPGIGHWDTTVDWVELPALATIQPRDRAPDHWSRIAIEPFSGEPTSQVTRSVAQRWTLDARRVMRPDETGVAALALVEAANRDPSNAFVRYHLARLLALDAQRERAHGLLDELRASGCPACEVVVRAARADPLFSSWAQASP